MASAPGASFVEESPESQPSQASHAAAAALVPLLPPADEPVASAYLVRPLFDAGATQARQLAQALDTAAERAQKELDNNDRLRDQRVQRRANELVQAQVAADALVSLQAARAVILTDQSAYAAAVPSYRDEDMPDDLRVVRHAISVDTGVPVSEAAGRVALRDAWLEAVRTTTLHEQEADHPAALRREIREIRGDDALPIDFAAIPLARQRQLHQQLVLEKVPKSQDKDAPTFRAAVEELFREQFGVHTPDEFFRVIRENSDYRGNRAAVGWNAGNPQQVLRAVCSLLGVAGLSDDGEHMTNALWRSVDNSWDEDTPSSLVDLVEAVARRFKFLYPGALLEHRVHVRPQRATEILESFMILVQSAMEKVISGTADDDQIARVLDTAGRRAAAFRDEGNAEDDDEANEVDADDEHEDERSLGSGGAQKSPSRGGGGRASANANQRFIRPPAPQSPPSRGAP